MKKKTVVSIILLASSMIISFAQEVHLSDKMWSKKVVRAIDLRERQNESLFAKGNEISKILLNGLKNNQLKPYLNDSLNKNTILTKDEISDALKLPSNFVEEDTSYMDSLDLIDYYIAKKEAENSYYLARDLYQLEITEELIFDKNRSVLSRNILAITIFIPADHPENIKSIQLPIASFDYKECINLFKNASIDAFWFNRNNDSAHLNLADAFELRLFSSYLIKVSNPSDEYLIDKYGGDSYMGIIGSEIEENKLMEIEHNMWEN